jgi:hypothetical protein
MKMEARRAVPKPSILKASPIIAWAIINVTALMTNKNVPRVKTVIGNVNNIRNGFTKTFNTDKIILATIAAPTPLK